MSTNDFIFILFWCLFGELIVLGIGVPIVLWAWRRTAPQREIHRQNSDSQRFIQQAHDLLDEIYSDIKSGTIVAPQELEDRVLATCGQANDLNYGRRAIR